MAIYTKNKDGTVTVKYSNPSATKVSGTYDVKNGKNAAIAKAAGISTGGGGAKSSASSASKATTPTKDYWQWSPDGTTAQHVVGNTTYNATTAQQLANAAKAGYANPLQSSDAIAKQMAYTQQQMQQVQMPQMNIMPMSLDQATSQATSQLSPEYVNKFIKAKQAINANASMNGLFGQNPTVSLTNEAQQTINNERDANIANLAQGLIDNDYARQQQAYNNAVQDYNLKIQPYQDKVNLLQKALDDVRQQQVAKDNNAYRNENLDLKQQLAMLPYQQLTANQQAQQDAAQKKLDQAYQLAMIKAASSGGGGGLTPYQQFQQQKYYDQQQQEIDNQLKAQAQKILESKMPVQKDAFGNVISKGYYGQSVANQADMLKRTIDALRGVTTSTATPKTTTKKAAPKKTGNTSTYKSKGWY